MVVDLHMTQLFYVTSKLFTKNNLICASMFTSGSDRELTESPESSYVLVYNSYSNVTIMATVLVAMCEDGRSERKTPTPRVFNS